MRLGGAPATLSETDLIQSLVRAMPSLWLSYLLVDFTNLPHQVLQFLQHDGYVETARAFAQEIQSERQALATGGEAVYTFNVKDDQDATNRQRKLSGPVSWHR